jgi:hypothetical protein
MIFNSNDEKLWEIDIWAIFWNLVYGCATSPLVWLSLNIFKNDFKNNYLIFKLDYFIFPNNYLFFLLTFPNDYFQPCNHLTPLAYPST